MFKTSLKLFSTAGLLSITAMVAFSAQAADSEKRGERRGAPKAAFTACEGKSTGDTCTMTTRRGEKSGTCAAPRGDKIVCIPEGHEQRKGQKN